MALREGELGVVGADGGERGEGEDAGALKDFVGEV